MSPQFLMGMPVIISPFATKIRTEFKVTAWAARRKKRKNWRVLCITTEQPCLYLVSGTLIVHPVLMPKLKAGLLTFAEG